MKKELARADGVVNTTPLGMAKYPGMAFLAELLRPEMWVAEIVYFPLETELLREARARGCRTMSGGGMAVFQAVGAFRPFHGHRARRRSHAPAFCDDVTLNEDQSRPNDGQ